MVDVSPLKELSGRTLATSTSSNSLAPSKPLGSVGLDSLNIVTSHYPFVGQLLNNVGDLFSSSSVSAAHSKMTNIHFCGMKKNKSSKSSVHLAVDVQMLCQTVMYTSSDDSNPHLPHLIFLPNSQFARWGRLARFQCGLWPLWEDCGTSPPRSMQLGKSTAGRRCLTLTGRSPSTWPASPSIWGSSSSSHRHTLSSAG